MTYKELLKKKLTKKEMELIPTSFDIVGSKEKAVALIEIPKELEKKEKTIAKAIMQKHKNVKSVLKKSSPIKGVFRVREYKLIAGDKNTEVTHTESGCRFILDPRTSYFSPREGTERLRIAEKVLEGETIMVFFAGVGPFPLVIEKKSKPKLILAVEINPMAVDYFLDNTKLNKSKLIHIVLGDVRETVEDFYGKCDRVVMPLPETSIHFLEESLKCLKKHGTCHLYCFSEEVYLHDKKDEIDKIAKHMKKKIKFTEVQKVLPYGPRIWKYRIDFEVL